MSMRTTDDRVWFRAKKYGWGWGPPCCWQGWVVYLIWWIALLLPGGMFLAPRSIPLFVAYACALGLMLLAVTLIKGEKPRWRWGDSEDRLPRSSAERLAELEELRRQRLVSDTEYEAKRQEILRGL